MQPQSKYLVLSRGHWDPNAAEADIDEAIARFYERYSSNLAAGRMEPGSRLSTEAAMVSKSGILMDGPFCEAKEVIGGYWIIVAPSLREAAEVAAQNPCVAYGLQFEIRPLEAERASAYKVANETPGREMRAS